MPPLEVSPPIDGGAAFVFERDQGGPNVWGLVKQLAAQQAAASDHYGEAVAIAGDNIWVGAQLLRGRRLHQPGDRLPLRARPRAAPAHGARRRPWRPTTARSTTTSASMLDVSGTTIAVSANGRSSDRGAVYAFSESDTPASYAVYLPLAMEQYIAPNGILPDGGVFQRSFGAIVGVVEGTLTEALPVLLVETTAPTQTLDAGAPVGAYYLLAAERVALAPVDKPFLIGLPVPDGVITDDLAVAALLPPGSVLDADENAANVAGEHGPLRCGQQAVRGDAVEPHTGGDDHSADPAPDHEPCAGSGSHAR